MEVTTRKRRYVSEPIETKQVFKILTVDSVME
jgi:hypothetical protein